MTTALAAARAKTKGKRMLRDALEGYGEDAFTLSEWNEKKRDAEARGEWTWKRSVANTNAAVKSRIERDGGTQEALRERFIDIQTAMEQEMSGVLHARGDTQAPLQPDDESVGQCSWRDRIGGKPYHCTTDLPVDRKKPSDKATESPPLVKRFCRWHARVCECAEHPMERSRAIEIPNEFGLCLHCYEVTATVQRATLQKVPPRVMAVKVPGVSVTDLRRDVQREMMLKSGTRRGGSAGNDNAAGKLTAKSVCTWEKEHYEKAYIWRCSNRVLMHPTLNGSFLPFCGFHAPRCIKEYGRKSKKDVPCPALERLNAFGMCRNHLEAHMSTLSFEARGTCVLVDSEFDVPGIKECRRDRLVAAVTRHPLAPKHPPPASDSAAADAIAQLASQGLLAVVQESVVKRALLVTAAFVRHQAAQALAVVLDSPNSVSMVLKEVIWRMQFARRARVVATHIQRIFRGNRARRRVRSLRYEHAALRRIEACFVVQRFVRGFLGRQRFKHEHENVHRAVPVIQRIVRGGLARQRCRRLRAAVRLQRNYRCYRQRLLAWAFREEMAYMRALQLEADENLREMEEKLTAFRRLRARRLLRVHILQWRKRREVRAHEFALRLQTFWSATKIQRQWRRHQRYQRVKKRYQSAQVIQKHVRGWLTRHMWREDPGVLSIIGFINPRSGFEYGKVVVLAQPSRSYSYPSRRIRMLYGCLSIQRVFRGHLGRLRANEQWVNMLRRWEWIGIESTDSSDKSSDSMAVGKERYGFVLPSHGYNKEWRLHMQPIVHDIKAARGFAYKYQGILDLIKDRDGLRAWSHTHEQREQKKHERLAQQSQQQIQPTKSAAFSASPTKSCRGATSNAAGATNTSLLKALFPVGAVVRVAVFNTAKRGPAFQTAKVVRIHSGSDTRESDDTTFDVEYDPVLVSIHGVRIYNEQHVRGSRLQVITHADITDPPPERRVSVGRQIQQAICELKKDIDEARRRKQLGFLVTGDLKHEPALDSVDAIAERLRDDRPGSDLLADDAAFVNFVFRNSTLLETAWMQVVSGVRHGKQRESRSSVDSQELTSRSTLPTRAVDFYATEFRFAHQASEDKARGSRPQPKRAATIEQRLVELGFQRALGTSANNKPVRMDDKHDWNQRPETTNGRVCAHNQSVSRGTRDDLALQKLSERVQTSQDIHRLIYELKTLPRERRREEIVEIKTRVTRAFVCGHPACGRCFSSLEAARLHQKTTHEHKGRLAVGTPLTDQYLHAYWPPQSPWNRETHATFQYMVGYFHCARPGCEQVEFRTRHELHRHMTRQHGAVFDASVAHEDDYPVVEAAVTTLRTQTMSIVWLGSYSICGSLNDKLALPRSVLDIAVCTMHTRTPDPTCHECERQQSCPSLPCKLYSSVALTLGPGASRDAVYDSDESSAAETTTAAAGLGSFTIFSVHDREFCPIVLRQNLVPATAPRERKRKEKQNAAARSHAEQRARDESSEVTYIQISALCRDSRSEDWILGRSFRRLAAAAGGAVVVHKQETGAHEVVLDEQLVFAKLMRVVGAARVRLAPTRSFEVEGARATIGEGSREACVLSEPSAQAAAATASVFVAQRLFQRTVLPTA